MIHPALLHVPTPNWAALAWSMPYGWYEPPPPPDLSDLPPPGRYHLDPARSSVRAQVRGLRRWQAGSAGVTGTLRFGRGSAAVELAVETAGLHSGDPERDRTLHGVLDLDPPSFPLVRFTATELAAAHGAWLVPGQVTLRGRAVPVALWIDPVDRLPDGTITSACAERWSAGRAGSPGGSHWSSRWSRPPNRSRSRRRASPSPSPRRGAAPLSEPRPRGV